MPDKEGHKTHFTVHAPVPKPETEHARAKRHFTEEAEKASQEKARQIQEQTDRQQGLLPSQQPAEKSKKER